MGCGSRRLAQVAILAVVVASAGCRDKPSERPGPSAEAAAPAAPSDAAPAPDAGRAAEVLRRFAAAVVAGDLAAARGELRLPPSLPEEEVDTYLRELAAEEHITVAGVEALVAAGSFGSLEQVFGDAGPNVAANARLEGEAYAFGDADAAAVLSWDGQRFLVVAVHNLASLETEGE